MQSSAQESATMEEVHQQEEEALWAVVEQDPLRDETQVPQLSDKQQLLNLVVSKYLRNLVAVFQRQKDLPDPSHTLLNLNHYDNFISK